MLAMIQRQRLRAAAEAAKPAPRAPIDWTEVLRRIRAGIEADQLERAEAHRSVGLSFRGCGADGDLKLDDEARADLADDFACCPVTAYGRPLSVCEVFAGKAGAGAERINQGYSVRPMPMRNRRTDYTVRDDNVVGDVVVKRLIEHQRKRFLALVKNDPTWIETAFAAWEADPMRPRDLMAAAQADEALGWIVEKEADRDLDEARQITLFWLQTELPQRAFCVRFGVNRITLRREVEKYCKAIAQRLNEAPLRPAAPIADNGRVAHAPPPRLVWTAPIASRIPLSDSETIVRGVEAIALATNRKPASVVRSIEGGTLPAAKIDGEWVAFSETISKSPYRKKSKPALLAA